VISFGNEINIWSKNLFRKVLDNTQVSAIFLPSITLDTSLIAERTPHFIKAKLSGKIVLGTQVYPTWVSLERLRDCIKQIKGLTGKKIIASLTYLKINSLTLIAEKIRDIFSEIDGIEINLIPALYKLKGEERELLFLKTAEALRTIESLHFHDVYVKIPFAEVRERHVKALIDGGVDYVILSLHQLILHKNTVYALHSPYISQAFLQYFPLAFHFEKDYWNKIGISADFYSLEHVAKLINEYSLVQLDFNLLSEHIFPLFGETPPEDYRPISPHPRAHLGFKAAINTSKCDACEGGYLCMNVCPEDAVVLEKNELKVNIAKCTACGLCMAMCPRDAIYWVRIISP